MSKTPLGIAFIDLWKSSALIQGTIALVSVGVISYLYITGSTVPDTLVSIVFTILGYYFGTKAQQKADEGIMKHATKRTDGID